MDLPTCPSCSQSVLDEEATECPFCGAAMSGASKPSGSSKPAEASKPKPKAKTSVKPPPSRPMAKPATKLTPAGQSATAVENSATDDEDDHDIIAADQEAIKRAFPVSRERVKGYTHEVACPMCEAPGYIPKKAAGRDVKCHNPACMVPIFTAPAIEVKEEEPEPESSGLLPLILGGATVAVLLIGVGSYFLFFRGRPARVRPVVDNTPPPTAVSKTNNKTDGDIENTDEVFEQGPSLETIQRDALTTLIKASGRAPRTRKPVARHWCAVAAAQMGDITEAQKQVSLLRRVGKTVPFLQTTPLVAIGWQQLKAGNSSELEKTLSNARAAAAELRPQGRYRYDASVSLAALLAASGHTSDARKLVSKHYSATELGNLSASMLIARDASQFDFRAAEQAAPIGGWSAPQTSAVAALLVAQGYPEVALKWAEQSGSPKTRCETTMAWAEFLLRRSATDELPGNVAKIQTVIEKLSTAGQALIQARLAWVLTDLESTELAQQAATAAEKTLAEIKVPAPLQFPDYGSVIKYRFPNQTAGQLSALASAELARLQLVTNQTDAAMTSLQRSLNFTRAIAPGTLPIQKRLDQISQAGALLMRRELKAALKLPNDDDARRKFDTYNRYCARLRKLAIERFALQQNIVQACIGPDSLESIADLIRNADSPDAGDAREPFLATKLPDLIVGRFRLAGQEDKASNLEQAISRSAPVLGQQLAKVEFQLANEKPRAAADLLSNLTAERSEQSRIVLSYLSTLVSDGQWKQALQICLQLEQQTLAEEGLILVAGQTTVLGQPSELIAFAKSQKPTLVERISINAGIVVGLAQLPDSQSTADTVPGEKTAARIDE